MSPKRLVGCRGGSRYVEGCLGFPYLKIKKFLGLLVFGLLVVRLLGFLVLKSPLNIFKRYVTYAQMSNSCFFIEIDLISRILKMSLDGSSGFFGARLFEFCHLSFQSFEIHKKHI